MEYWWNNLFQSYSMEYDWNILFCIYSMEYDWNIQNSQKMPKNAQKAEYGIYYSTLMWNKLFHVEYTWNIPKQ